PQIIVVDPSVTPSPSLVFNTPIIPTLNFATAIPPNIIKPTTQFVPYNPAATALPLVFATDTPQTFAQSMMLGMGGGGGDYCAIKAAIPNSTVNLYAGPGTTYPAINTFAGDDELVALGKSDNGWYQAQYTARGNQWVGWVRQELVYTSGSCDTLPLIPAADYRDGTTPTTSVPAPSVDPPSVTITSDNINLRGGPGTNYPIVGAARLGDSFHVEAQSLSGGQLWYLVTISGARSAWIFSTLVQLSPANALISPAATIPPSPMPTASAPPPPTLFPTITPGPNIVAGTWSQTITVLTTTCAGSSSGSSTTMPVTLTVSADAITLSFAEAGTPVILSRSADRVYSGGYSTPNNSVSVTLTFTSSTGYAGTASVTQNDGCSTQSAWNGLFQSS
ncbi:MAG: SH3 domain-containing protein, partial [Chloroflexota bacterium]